MPAKKILIVGGGNAGLSVASQLLRKTKDHEITIIDPSDKHYYQPAWTLVGAGVYNINDTVRKQADYIPKGATWVKDAVREFFPEENKIVTDKGETYHYDAMVVCPGLQLDWHKISGFKETLGKNNVTSNYSFDIAPYTWELIKDFKGGTAVFTNPVGPIKCGGAPHKIMYLACDHWRKQGILDKCNVQYLSGAGVIFDVKEYADTLTEVIREYNIHPHFNVNVKAIEGDNQIVYYEEKNEAGETITRAMKFDLCHVVPPQSAPDFIKNSSLPDPNNAYGYVEVDKNTMQHARYPNVFALGDCIAAPAKKTGAAIRKQAPVVVNNLLSYLQLGNIVDKYEGYSACPIPTQYGKLMLAEFDYTNKPKMSFAFDQVKPRWSMWILKTKILPWLYWNKILKGTA